MSKTARIVISGFERRLEELHPVALFLLFFSPVSAYMAIAFNGGNTLLFEDGMLQSFPFRVFLHNAFANGYSPQWVPSSACGFSLLAEGQNGICFPATQIIYRLFSAETGWLVEMMTARFSAFMLCTLLLRQLHCSWVGSLFGASVFAFCTATFGLENVPALMWCHALLPGIFLSCLLFIEKRTFSFVYVTMFSSCVFLIGHPVMVVYIGIAVLAFFLFHWGTAGTETARGIGLRLAALLGSILAALLIASPQLLPMLEEFRFSARTTGAGISLDALQNTLHLEPVWLPLSLFPTPLQWVEWGGMSNTIRFPLYALILSCIGMLSGTKCTARRYFVFLGLFAVLMALGPYVGLWKLVHSLPVLKYFRFPYRWLFFLPICVAYLSARGIDHLLDRQKGFPSFAVERILKSGLLTAIVVGSVLVAVYHSRFLLMTRKALEYAPLLTGMLWLCSVGMLLAAFFSLGRDTARRGVLLGVTLSVLSMGISTVFNIKSPMAIHDLGTIGWHGSAPPNEPQGYRTSSDLSPYDVWLTNTMNRHYPYTPNLTVLNGTLTTGHYFSFFPYWSANVSTWCRDALKGDQGKQIYLDVSSAKWLFLQDDSSEKSVGSTAAFKGMDAYINHRAVSRASVVSNHHLFTNEKDLLAFMESPGFDPRRGLALLGKDAEAWGLQGGTKNTDTAAISSEATIMVDRPDHIEIELTPAASKRTYLVLSDTYYPGWKASVDGVEKKILRANYAFRGIQLPEGARHVVFSYDPLVPDAALPLPTLLLVTMGIAMYVRRYSGGRR